MADAIVFEFDMAPLEAKLLALGDLAQPYVNEASAVTAQAGAAEARARLARQVGPDATGRTEAGITARPAYDGNGWVILVERDPFPNLPLWIEKGTKAGEPGSHTAAPRPFFYPAVALEVPAHERRLAEALARCFAAQGLGA